ncbi:restriction endonuclease [bacterium (Candidatus Gribaldobacteria) CG10_big_fil_rev_8_21_14_0_10_37_21]|uniref:Restriction endonuclease n=1 Tax=bacterium (Candidatus Gribaldobacteria) CG10_big_fil_rev_8_21_14_0_10_37_21 TaxID=2014275 RepID=A0A2H0UTN7_9BACT|nr:MAG: restriction endonuclease [Parcubacteria group bacterium CG1_02_37_13]PIR90104.1 MAG: restriction endonuclease [bacterium (Candidatus Gribaldobacteria) CG10_big_fil_rev_8_21_14_0_10_37_21]
MSKAITITAEYFQQYRRRLGFANQAAVKDFFGAKDITPTVDFNYVKILNKRLYAIIDKVDAIVVKEIKTKNLLAFKEEHIDSPFQIMKESGILPILNNQGRRPEQVYFSWMRGFVISSYFLKALGLIFGVNTSKIDLIGDDDLRSVETFKRTPKADLEIKLKEKEKIRIEMQAGFTGINDIKQHKVLEAKRVFRDKGIHSLAIHFDLYNGQVAFIKLDEIKDNSVNWITRQQMEGQTVFNIDQNYFIWKITEKPVKYKEINFD